MRPFDRLWANGWSFQSSTIPTRSTTRLQKAASTPTVSATSVCLRAGIDAGGIES